MMTHTPGPFFVNQPDKWPYDIEVLDSAGHIVWSERRHAHSTQQRSLSDCMRAVGFAYDERPKIIEALERQVADIRLRAAAPDLLAALKKAREWVELGPELPGVSAKDEAEARQALAEIDAALAKAEATP